jgi:hypothetical protein
MSVGIEVCFTLLHIRAEPIYASESLLPLILLS